jgi:hypothetical protein
MNECENELERHDADDDDQVNGECIAAACFVVVTYLSF